MRSVPPPLLRHLSIQLVAAQPFLVEASGAPPPDLLRDCRAVDSMLLRSVAGVSRHRLGIDLGRRGRLLLLLVHEARCRHAKSQAELLTARQILLRLLHELVDFVFDSALLEKCVVRCVPQVDALVALALQLVAGRREVLILALILRQLQEVVRLTGGRWIWHPQACGRRERTAPM